MRAARSRIDAGADAATNRPSLGIFIVSVEAWVMIFVFFKNGKCARWRGVPAFTGRKRAVDRNLSSRHLESPLL